MPRSVAYGFLRVATATLTRPADTTAYTAGDVVSNNATTTTPIAFSDIFPKDAGTGYLVGARLSTDKKSITPRIRLHLFNASTATVAADNAAFKEVYADAGKRLGYVDLPAMTTATDSTNSDMSRAFDLTLRVPIVAAAGDRDLHVVLEALDAFTPASGQQFSLTLYVDAN